MAFLTFNITVGAGGVTLADLGNRTYPSGTTDIGQEYEIEVLRYSRSLAEAIHNGDITSATDSVGRVITAQGTLDNTITLLNRAGHVFDTDELDEGSTNLYFTQARARESISIASGSQSLLGYDDTTGELSVEQLLITDVTVDITYTSLADFVADGDNIYTSKVFEEGDVVILTNAQPSEKTVIHNGGTAGTVADWTIISTNLDDAYIRGLFDGSGPITYNPTTGVFGLLFDNDTIITNSSGEIFVDETALTIDVSQVSGLASEVENIIFDSTNFVDSSTIDFTVTAGTSVTAIVINDSINADKLAVTGNGTSGQVLTSNGDGTFSWANDQDTTYTAGDALDLDNDEFNVLFDNDTIKLNTAGELFVDQAALAGLTFENGLTEDSGTVKLGGTLNENTTINGDTNFNLELSALSNFIVQVNDGGTNPSGFLQIALSGLTRLSQTSNTGNKLLDLAQNEVILRNAATGSEGGGDVILSNDDSRITYRPDNGSDLTSLIVEDGFVRLSNDNTDIGGRLLLDEDDTSAGQDGLMRWNGDNFQGYKDGSWVNLDEQDTTYTAGDALDLDNDEFNVLFDNDTIKINSSGELFVDQSALAGLTFENGLTETAGTVRLGGTLTQATTIDANGNDFIIEGNNTSSIIRIGNTGGSPRNIIIDESTGTLEVNMGTNTTTFRGFRTDFDSSLVIGDSEDFGITTFIAGEIRWDGDNFQGYDGNGWVNLDEGDTTYTAGDGITLTGTEFSADLTYLNANLDFDDYDFWTISDGTTNSNINSEDVLTVTGDDGVTIDVTGSTLTVGLDGNLVPDGNSVGDILYWDGTEWETLEAGDPGELLTVTTAGTPEWSGAPDSNKKSWTWGAASNAQRNTDRYLDKFDGVATNIAPYVAWYDCELKAISATQDGTASWTAEVHVNGTSVATLSVTGATASTVLSSPVSISAGDTISFYVDGTNITRPSIDAFFEED